MTPCAATMLNLLKRLDVVCLEACLTKWVFSRLESLQVWKTQDLQAVAIRWQNRYVALKYPESGYRTYLLSAVSHEIGITLAQTAIRAKTNEIPF